MSFLKVLHGEIQHRKYEALEILRARYSDEHIKELCTRFINAPENADLQNQLTKEGHPPESFYALTSLCCLMYLEKNIPPSSDHLLSAEDSANLILTGFNAMLTLVEAGWTPAEPLAMTRLKQMKNQPSTRERTNIERDEIESLLFEYKEEKGVFPTSLAYFLEYLDIQGFIVDSAKRSVEARNGNWRRERSFRTIDGWLREIKKG